MSYSYGTHLGEVSECVARFVIVGAAISCSKTFIYLSSHITWDIIGTELLYLYLYYNEFSF